MDAGLAVPQRKEDGVTQMGSLPTTNNGLGDPAKGLQSLNPQISSQEASNGKEKETIFEENNLERSNHRSSQSPTKHTPKDSETSAFEKAGPEEEEGRPRGREVRSPVSATRRLRLEEAGNLLKPPPGSQQSYSVQGLRKFITGSPTQDTDKSSSSSPPELSRSEKRRSILDHLRPTFSKSKESEKKEEKEMKDLPLSCGQLALVGELPAALLNLPTTAELLGDQSEHLVNSKNKSDMDNLNIAVKLLDDKAGESERETTTDIDRSETYGSEVLGHSASLPKLNKGTSSLLVADSSKDPGRPLPSKKVTLVRKKSLSENCLLPKPRIQRRDGQVINKPFICSVFSPLLCSLSFPCKLRFVTMLTVDIQVTSSQTLCGDETVPVRNQMASRYNNAMVEIKETDCPTIAQIESPIYIIFLFVKVFQLSTQLYFQQAGRLLSGRPDPSERKTLGGDCFMLDSKSNILKIFYLHFSWSWRTTSEVLRSWPRVSAMSNQSTQIGGKSLLLSFIESERG